MFPRERLSLINVLHKDEATAPNAITAYDSCRRRWSATRNRVATSKLLKDFANFWTWREAESSIGFQEGPPAFAREASEGCRAEAQRAKAGRAASASYGSASQQHSCFNTGP